MFSFLCVVTCGASVLGGRDHRITAGVEEHRSDVSDVIDAGLESAGGRGFYINRGRGIGISRRYKE